MTDEMNYKEEYEELKKELETLKARYFKAREEAISRQDYAAALASNKLIRAYRKASKAAGREDPFKRLRPEVTQAEAGILFNIDSRTYKNEKLVLRGWSYDQCGLLPNIMIRDKSKVLSFDIQRYPRADVNDLLGINASFNSGFSIRLPLDQIRNPIITFELENELGYVAKQLKVILDKKKRDAYIRKHAVPTYAVDSAGYDDWFHDHRFNTPEKFLDELMEGLLGQSYANIEICLADGSTKDDTEKQVREKYLQDRRVKYQRLKVNAGISGNTNEAIKMASGDWIMLSDHDDTVEKDEGQYDDIVPLLWGTGAALMVRASDWRESGGLDARFFAHMEEIDLCWRLRTMGKSIVCISESKAYHLGGATLNQGNPRKTFLNFRNNLLMLYKNLPDAELKSVMRTRRFLDYLAALQFLLKGDTKNFSAVFKARHAFYDLLPDFEKDRRHIQQLRKNERVPERVNFSLLWQYYVKGKKKFSELTVDSL